MQINEECLRNPLRRLGFDNDDILSKGAFGAISARAGVGKTSILVQLALNAMLRKKSVLHISLNNPVNKINLWYREIFERFTEHYHISGANQIWQSLLPYRFILTLQVDGFSVPRLDERLRDLTEQNIFHPELLIIDGLPFDDPMGEVLTELRKMLGKNSLSAWFSVRTHRHETPGADGLPVQLAQIDHLFETVIQLKPEKTDIHVSLLKGGNASAEKAILRIDPATMIFLDNRG